MKPALAILVVLSASITVAEDPPFFPDENLKRVVESSLGIIDPAPTDMLGMESLEAWGKGIAFAAGLEYATSLTRLSFNPTNSPKSWSYTAL